MITTGLVLIILGIVGYLGVFFGYGEFVLTVTQANFAAWCAVAIGVIGVLLLLVALARAIVSFRRPAR